MTMPVPVECCPELMRCQSVTRIRPTYRIIHTVPGDNGQTVRVEAAWHLTLTRTTGETMLGPVVKSVNLLPGQTVRLSIQDKASKFSYDTESTRVHREAHASSASYYSAGMASAFSSLSSVSSGRTASTFHESAISGGGGAGLDLGFFEIGGSVNGSSHDASSTTSFLNSLSQTSRSQSSHWEAGTQTAYASSVGYVSTRTHAEGESEEHSEAATHVYRNENRCHAVNHRFHQLMEEHTVKLTVEAVVLRVIDPDASTGTVPVVPRPLTGLAPKPEAVSVLSPQLAEKEDAARKAATARTALTPQGQDVFASRFILAIPPADAQRALDMVRDDLMRAGLIDQDGSVTEQAQARFGWEQTLCLPLDGLHVMSCLSDCNTCEHQLERRIDLELDHLGLQNEMLRRQIELMDRDQEHRSGCCPDDVPGS